MQPSQCSKQELQVMVADLAFRRFTFFSSTGYTHHRLNIPYFLHHFSLLSIYKGNKSADAGYIIIFGENFLIQKASLLFFVATVIGFSSYLIYQNTSLKDTSRLGNHLFIFISSSSELLFHYRKVVSHLDLHGFTSVFIFIHPHS